MKQANKFYLFVAIFLLLVPFVACSSKSVLNSPTGSPVYITVPVTFEVTRMVEVVKEVQVTVEVTRTTQARPTPEPVETKIPEVILEKNAKFSGTYQWSGNNEGQGCTLKISHTLSGEPLGDIYSRFFSRIKFELECCRGDPSYNLGSAQGIILEESNTAVYLYQSIYSDETCYLIFNFFEDQVEIKQIGSSFSCGFGHAVYADGIYQRISSEGP